MFSNAAPESWLRAGPHSWDKDSYQPNNREDRFAHLDLGDEAVARATQRLRRCALSNLPVLLHGETGTGKELFARAVHETSGRRDGPFIAVNCASIPEGLIESELFGHRPGAFTGASNRGARGLAQQAHGGTLFLDEIGDMPLALQSRLLRVLAEKEVTPIGGDAPIKIDFRVVSATHRNLQELVARGEFREDLMFRLQGLSVTLPPLRSRTDIVLLTNRLLSAEQETIGRCLSISECALRRIRQSSWPGNVRQLKQVLAAAAWLAEEPSITETDIEAAMETLPQSVAVDHVVEDFDSVQFSSDTADEKGLLLVSLKRNRWNVSLTAREHNTARTTIYRRMARLGIVQPHLLPA